MERFFNYIKFFGKAFVNITVVWVLYAVLMFVAVIASPIILIILAIFAYLYTKDPKELIDEIKENKFIN